MLCSNCGNDIPEGQSACPYCGAQMMNGGVQPAYDPAQAYAPAQTYAPAQKSKKGLIIGLIAGLVAIVAVVLVLVFFVFGKGKADGTYVCQDYAAFGMDVSLEIDGDEFVLEMSAYGESETIEGKCKVDGDTITLTYEGEDVECDYDKKEGTIDFEGMIFTKE